MFIITNRYRKLTPEFIAESLWPEQDYVCANDSVKNLVYRLRKQLADYEHNDKGSLIISDQGCYCWNTAYPYWFDVEEFERLCSDANLIKETDPEGASQLYRKALSCYQGDYLQEKTASEWIYPLRRYYHQKYIENLIVLLQLLKQLDRNEQIIKECEKAVLIEQFDEDIHLYYIEALINKGKISQARDHYEFVTSLYYRELGTKPSVALTKLYRTIQGLSEEHHFRMADIRDILQERDMAEGALHCEPDYFRFLCKMERRRATREDRPIHLGLISITDAEYHLPLPELLKKPMDTIRKILLISLRRGDVFSLWNEGQYVVLLPGSTRENAELSLSRISNMFKEEARVSNYVVRTSVYPIIPHEYL